MAGDWQGKSWRHQEKKSVKFLVSLVAAIGQPAYWGPCIRDACLCLLRRKLRPLCHPFSESQGFEKYCNYHRRADAVNLPAVGYVTLFGTLEGKEGKAVQIEEESMVVLRICMLLKD